MAEHAQAIHRAAKPAAAKAALEPGAAPASDCRDLLNGRPEIADLEEKTRMLNGRPALVAQRAAADMLSQRTRTGPRPIQQERAARTDGRTGLPSRLKSGVEAVSGLSMDDVRVHRDSAEPGKIGALAYARGSDIHLGPGQDRHLPHEAWHVVQQKRGRVRATIQLKGGVPVNDDPALEREADAMAPSIVQPRLRNEKLERRPTSGADAPVQGVFTNLTRQVAERVADRLEQTNPELAGRMRAMIVDEESRLSFRDWSVQGFTDEETALLREAEESVRIGARKRAATDDEPSTGAAASSSSAAALSGWATAESDSTPVTPSEPKKARTKEGSHAQEQPAAASSSSAALSSSATDAFDSSNTEETRNDLGPAEESTPFEGMTWLYEGYPCVSGGPGNYYLDERNVGFVPGQKVRFWVSSETGLAWIETPQTMGLHPLQQLQQQQEFVPGAEIAPDKGREWLKRAGYQKLTRPVIISVIKASYDPTDARELIDHWNAAHRGVEGMPITLEEADLTRTKYEAGAPAQETAATSSSPGGQQQAWTVAMPDGTQVQAQVLNDSGGYHLILQHPTNNDMIIRLRKDERATPTETGLANLGRLNAALKGAVRGIRTPQIHGATDMVYVVEKVSGTVDAWSLWQKFNSPDCDSETRERLEAIRTLVQRNIDAAHQRKQEPFPDFRPSNVGVKEGSPDLIYIDFDQSGEVKELPDLVDHIQEWAGRRLQRDPGGARKFDPDFYSFLTGRQLIGMKSTTEMLATGIG